MFHHLLILFSHHFTWQCSLPVEFSGYYKVLWPWLCYASYVETITADHVCYTHRVKWWINLLLQDRYFSTGFLPALSPFISVMTNILLKTIIQLIWLKVLEHIIHKRLYSTLIEKTWPFWVSTSMAFSTIFLQLHCCFKLTGFSHWNIVILSTAHFGLCRGF